jgi:myo-inositol-1(or 4)-monophosphatase
MEAGGKVTDFDGSPYNVFEKQTLATNGLIHDAMLRTIKKGSN